MPFLKKVNNARSTVNQIGGISDSDLTLIVTDASDFPTSGNFLITIWDNVSFPDPSDDLNQEIIKVTDVSGNTFTIERGQQNTIAHSHSNNEAVQMLITAGHFEEIENKIDLVISGKNIFNDELTDQLDGITTEFQTSFDYEPTTLKVFLGGLRLSPGIGKDYIETGDNTFEFNYTPNSSEKLIVDYLSKGTLISNIVFNDELSSQVGSGNTTFTTSFNYDSGSLQVYVGGQRLIRGIGKDFVETGSNTFELTVAPNDNIRVIVDYTTNNTVSGSVTPKKDDFTSFTDGIKTDFELSFIPIEESLDIHLEGIYQAEGSGRDYELNPDSGQTKIIRFTKAPATGAKVIARYIIDT